MSMPHICTVEHETSKTYLPFREGTRNPFIMICRGLQEVLLVWKRHPQFTYYHRSTTAYLNERKRHALGRYFYIIHPLSKLSFFVELALVMAYALAFLNFPIVAAFHNFRAKGESQNLIEYILQGIFVAEIVFRLFLGRKHHRLKEITLNHFKIIELYLFSPMIIVDVAGILPVLSLVKCFPNINILHGIAVLRFLKFLRIRNFIEGFAEILKILGLNVYSGVLNVLILTSFFFHWCVCLYYGVPRIRSALTGPKAINTSIIHYYVVDNTTVSHYIETAWRTMGILMAAKREIRVRTGEEHKMICCVFLICGKIFMLIVGVVIINQVFRNGELETKYREVLGQLNEFMTHKELPAATRQRLLTFYDYKFQGKFVRENKIQNILSDRLKKEINFHSSNKLVKQVEMFEEIPTKILAEILSNLKVEVFLPNDIIIKSGSFVDSMYFISNGTVSVTTASGREVCHLQDGSYFGEACLILNHKKATSNVIALEICETYRLDSGTFRHCFKNHPEILSKMKNEAERREAVTNQLEQEFQEKLFLKTYLGERKRNTLESSRSIKEVLAK